MTTEPAAVKAALRTRLRRTRAERLPAERGAAAHGIAQILLAEPEMAAASVVAAYVDARGEPGTAPLLAALQARDVQVMLPVQRNDGELDWAWYIGAEALAAGLHDIDEPTGERLGPEAIASAQVVVVPALAVDRAGRRLGQGGGAYDRALRRSGDALTVAVVYPDEVLAEVPTESHDISVQAIATPTSLIRCGV